MVFSRYEKLFRVFSIYYYKKANIFGLLFKLFKLSSISALASFLSKMDYFSGKIPKKKKQEESDVSFDI